MKKHLLILGGGILNIAAINEAKMAGFIVYVADADPNAPGFNVADVIIHANITSAEAVYDAIKNYPINGIVSMAEAGVLTGALLNEKLKLEGIDSQTAKMATSKALMRQQWKDNGFSLEFQVVTNYEEAMVAADELNYFPLILKPDKTYGGSRGVSKVNDKTELLEAFEFAQSNGMNELVVIEHCTEAEEYSCEVLVTDSTAHLLCIGQKIKSPLPYRVDCSVQYPAKINEAERDKVKEMVQLATQQLGIKNGVAHIEFALTANGPRLFELGARCGGGHTPLIAKHVSGVNEFIEYANIACGIKPTIDPLKKMKGADYRFIIFEPGEIEAIEVSDEIKKHKGIYDLVVQVKAGDRLKELRTTSQRCGAVITFGDHLEEAAKLADWACNNIHVSYKGGKKSKALIYTN